jgi:hypothetical protein
MLAFLILPLLAGELAALTLDPGDLLVVDHGAFGGGGGIIRVDPATGTQTVLASGGFFGDPLGIAIAADGDLLVVDRLRSGRARSSV